MNQLKIPGALLFLSLSILPTAGMAAKNRDFESPARAASQHNGSPLVRITVLRPSAENEVKRRVLVLEYADGSRTVASSPDKMPLGNPSLEGEAVAWTVDLALGTYTAKKTEVTERDREFVRRSKERWSATDTTTRKNTIKNDEFDDDQGPQVYAGYSYLHAAETWEPAAYIGFRGLTRTEAELDWSECGSMSNGYLNTDAFLTSCWANPSSLGIGLTTWFNSYCDRTEPFPSSQSSLTGNVFGVYVNSDFGNPALPTIATERVSVAAHRGGYAFGWVLQDQSGEFDYLLSGKEFRGAVSGRPPSCSGAWGGGGSGGGGGGPTGGGGGRVTCIPVYSSGDYVGECCGRTTAEIIGCAENML